MVLTSSFEHSAPHTLFVSWNETTHSDKQIFKFWLIMFSLKNPPNPYELTLPLIDQIGMFLVSTVLDGINPHGNQVFPS